jgi:outer membrane immunogenic protein
MKKYLILASLLCSSLTFAASGDSYFGGGIHRGDLDIDGFSTVNPNAIKLEYGYYVWDSIAIEGHFAYGFGEDTVSSLDFKLKQAISLFAKADLSVGENSNVYGLLGLTKGKIEVSNYSGSDSEDDSGLSYGLGFETKIQSDLVFSTEYIMYLSEDDYDYSGINIGISKLF